MTDLECARCGRGEDEVESLSEVEDGDWYCGDCVEWLLWDAVDDVDDES